MDTEAKEVSSLQVSYIFYLLQYLSAPQCCCACTCQEANAASASRTGRGMIGSIAVKLAVVVTECLKYYAGCYKYHYLTAWLLVSKAVLGRGRCASVVQWSGKGTRLSREAKFSLYFSELEQLIFVEMRCPPSTHRREEWDNAGSEPMIRIAKTLPSFSLASHTLKSQEKEGLVTMHTTSCSGDRIWSCPIRSEIWIYCLATIC